MQYSSITATSSLYVHWPFCPYKCHFCPFVALASHDHFMERYHKALSAEIEQFSQETRAHAMINTIHFGGGTPSTYPPHLLRALFGMLNTQFMIDPRAEIALEINPGTVSPEKIEAWKQAGINRLSIGVQAVNDRVLQSLNRHQTSAQVFDLLRAVEPLFDNVSIDLILGLPGIDRAAWRELITQVVEWPIKHISIYFLTIHENTPLYFKVQANQVSLPTDEEVVASYEWTCDMLAKHGFEQYELSNFARAGYASQHNMAYWNRNAYKGFGIGACSFDGSCRFQNEKNIMKYMEACEQKRSPVYFAEQLTEHQIWLEQIMLGLRRPQGIPLTLLGHGKTITNREMVQHLMQEGYLEQRDSTIRLTRKGLSVENEILARLVQNE